MALLLLLLLTSQPPTASAQAATNTASPYRSDCNQTAGKYTENSTYLSNLQALGDALTVGASSSGFASRSTGVAPDQVHGLVLCRGDYIANCTDGLAAAFQDVKAQLYCPYYMDATIYYDQYMLRFTNNEYLLSSHTNAPEWYGRNMNLITGADTAARFMEKAAELMNKTADLAAFNSSSSLYATGETWFGEQGVSIVYGLVQCTPDLTGAQCRSCLRGIIAQMPAHFSSPAGSLVGGRILGVRCNLRYEKDLFFKETNSTLKLHMPKSM